MQKNLIALAIASAFAAPLASLAAEPTPEHSFTGNVTLASEYLYRGIAQTRGKPALQGGFDYAHKSGLYAGLWASNISWISDGVAGASASLEIDVYGGYKGSITDDFGYDVGVLIYNYPGSGKPTGNAKPDTTELYGALSWKWLSLKYSHTTGSLFGWTKPDGSKTKGSGYLELNANYDMGDGWTLIG
ncbi:MAG: TorF family putative porin, partial [Rhodocyclaceae bacterium]|nr:TorF family putative porin [Rhodocyclaceae bacterium]